MSKVITANNLATGVVVFLGGDRHWVAQIGEARVYLDDAAAADDLVGAKRDAERAIVVDPFVTDMRTDDEGRPSMSLRDRIRAFGPTIDFLPRDEAARG